MLGPKLENLLRTANEEAVRRARPKIIEEARPRIIEEARAGIIEEVRAEILAEGAKNNDATIQALVRKLEESGRSGDVARAVLDMDYRRQLLSEYFPEREGALANS